VGNAVRSNEPSSDPPWATTTRFQTCLTRIPAMRVEKPANPKSQVPGFAPLHASENQVLGQKEGFIIHAEHSISRRKRRRFPGISVLELKYSGQASLSRRSAPCDSSASPGLRIYQEHARPAAPRCLGGPGCGRSISNLPGVMSRPVTPRKQGVGGEVLCYIY